MSRCLTDRAAKNLSFGYQIFSFKFSPEYLWVMQTNSVCNVYLTKTYILYSKLHKIQFVLSGYIKLYQPHMQIWWHYPFYIISFISHMALIWRHVFLFNHNNWCLSVLSFWQTLYQKLHFSYLINPLRKSMERAHGCVM